jgi:hypothetical protein
MRKLLLAGCVLIAVSASAHARELSTNTLKAKWQALNEACYHNYDQPICRQMDPLTDKLFARGWCYGSSDQARAYWKWHRCTPKDRAYVEEPPCELYKDCKVPGED